MQSHETSGSSRRVEIEVSDRARPLEEHSKGRAISVISDVTENGAVAVYCIAGEPPQILKCYFDHATGAVKGMKKVEEFPITTTAPGHADASAKVFENQTLEVACGSCLYKMPGVEGCQLAIMVDGKPYLVEGAKWPNHDFCDRKLQAVVTAQAVTRWAISATSAVRS